MPKSGRIPRLPPSDERKLLWMLRSNPGAISAQACYELETRETPALLAKLVLHRHGPKGCWLYGQVKAFWRKVTQKLIYLGTKTWGIFGKVLCLPPLTPVGGFFLLNRRFSFPLSPTVLQQDASKHTQKLVLELKPQANLWNSLSKVPTSIMKIC